MPHPGGMWRRMRWRSLAGISALACALAQKAGAELSRVPDARLDSSQRVIRLGPEKKHSIWVKFNSKNFRQNMKALKDSLGALPGVKVEVESFYRKTGEARLHVETEDDSEKSRAIKQVTKLLRKNKKIKLVGVSQKIRISEMSGR